MFEALTKALEEHFPEGQNEIKLKALCELSGLKPAIWAERLKSISVGRLVRQELAKAGFTYTMNRRGRFNSFTFTRLPK